MSLADKDPEDMDLGELKEERSRLEEIEYHTGWLNQELSNRLDSVIDLIEDKRKTVEGNVKLLY